MIDVLCITSKLSIGGVQTYLINNVGPLLQYGIRLNFAVDVPEPQIYDEYVESLGCKIYRVTPISKSKLGFIQDVRKILKDNPSIKIVHGHRNFANIYSMIAAKGLAKYVSHAHNNYKPKSILNKVLKSVFKMILPWMSDGYWGCSSEAAQWLYGKHAKSNRCRIIKNAISTERFKFDGDKRISIRKSLNIDNKFVWVHIGTLSHAKNHKFLIDLFSESLKDDPNQHLILCGDGVLRDEIESQISELGIEEKITMTGNVNNAQDYLSAADLYVFPSLFEGFPLSTIEAQASGISGVVSMAVPDSCIINPNIKRIANLAIEEYLGGIAEISQINIIREQGALNVKQAGYDINEEAKKTAGYYMEILK